MRQDVKKYVEPIFEEYVKTIVFDDYMIRSTFGHTKAVSELEFKHSGGGVANYYAAATFLGKMGEEEGLNLLKEVEKLQIKDSKHPQFGGFIWYREETFIDDTNAAFFTLVPLATLCLCRPNLVPASHRKIMDGMFSRAIKWFSHECSQPKIYYPNKIISDGALLLALSVLADSEEGIEQGNAFFRRWEEYTKRRGWGWGENTSPPYLNIILDAFQLAIKAWEGREVEVTEKIRARRQEILDYVLFHAGKSFVPSIRSYYWESETIKPGFANYIANVRMWEKELLQNGDPIKLIKNIFLYEDVFPTEELIVDNDPKALSELALNLPLPRTRTEHIFDESYAYTWIGKNCRVGSINHFPVMPGMYHAPTWGIGWQSTPISFLVEDEQLSFLRFTVKEGENFRAHHANGFNKAYLNPALFREECLPEVEMHCAQKDNVMIAQRMIKNISNSASEIVDEWLIKRFNGKVHQLAANCKVKWTSLKSVTHSVPKDVQGEIIPKWVVLEFEKCYVAIMPLTFIACGATTADFKEIEINQEEVALRLSRILYRGEEAYLRQHMIDSGWVLVAFDEKISLDELQAELLKYEVSDERVNDFEVPRDDMFMIRKITVKAPNGTLIENVNDPYKKI